MTQAQVAGRPTARIAAVASAHPPLLVSQIEAAEALAGQSADARRIRAIARASRIDSRAIAAPLETLLSLRTIEQRNRIYRDIAPQLARRAASDVLCQGSPTPATLVTCSCTGYHLPGWGSSLVESLGLPCDTERLPITEAGCAGGVVAIRAAADVVRSRPGRPALAVAVELCSLSLHLDSDEGNLTSSLIFGDGAGAARIEAGPGKGLEILDSSSMLVPGTARLLGFELRDSGFFPVLRRELVSVLRGAAGAAIERLLARNSLAPAEISAWLLHPGGAAILRSLESALAVECSRTRWSWDSMRNHGNTSSAAIFDVLRRYLDDRPAPGEFGVVAAFGPGVAIELLLVRTC